jgi:predicted O-methyltransferase YrrM
MIENALRIDGWMSDRELAWLATTARNCELIAEVGCYRGRSTRALGDNCKGVIYAIDPFYEVYFKNDNEPLFKIGNKIYNIFINNIADLNNIIVLRDEFQNVVKDLPNLDFIFLDGDHRYEAVKKDIEVAQTIIKKGGIIAGHDYTHTSDWPGVKQAVDEAYQNINQIDSIWWIRNE